MPHLRVVEVAALLGVSDDTVRRWIARGELASEPDDSGRRVVDGLAAARLVRERARPVADPSTIRRSARNRLVGLVTSVTGDTVMARVEMLCAGTIIEALISAEAARELRLEPGSLAVAVVKATEVTVDGAVRPLSSREGSRRQRPERSSCSCGDCGSHHVR
ncbi:TOBE domain-containing protein [Pseudonocardia alaniniphila]|uniref:TOBE domain-containing protein n=1 Tax=Pseudonocardia alaniniphila TaxID=75291 RepID=UPI0030B8AB78